MGAVAKQSRGGVGLVVRVGVCDSIVRQAACWNLTQADMYWPRRSFWRSLGDTREWYAPVVVV